MGESISKFIVATTSINLYEVVAFVVKDKTLVVYTTSETLYFNEPKDVPDVAIVHTNLSTAYDALAGGSTTPPDSGTDDPGTTDPTTGGSSGGSTGSSGGSTGTNPSTGTGSSSGTTGSGGSSGSGSSSGSTGSGSSGGSGTPPDTSGGSTTSPKVDHTGQTLIQPGLWQDPATGIYYDDDGPVDPNDTGGDPN